MLAAMQALSVYVLVRMEEGETEYNNVDQLLQKTIIVSVFPLANVDIS